MSEVKLIWSEDKETPTLLCPECKTALRPHGYTVRGYLGEMEVVFCEWNVKLGLYQSVFRPSTIRYSAENLGKAQALAKDLTEDWISRAGLQVKPIPEQLELPFPEENTNDEEPKE